MDKEASSAIFQDAKNLFSQKEYDLALAKLQELKDAASEDFNLASKLAKLAGKLTPNIASLRPLNLAYLSSSTSVFLEPLIRLFGAFDGFDIKIQAGGFDSWRRDILDQSSWLYAYNPDAIIIAPNWRDANFSALTGEECAQTFANEISEYWKILKSKTSAGIFHLNLDLPLYDSCGFLSQTSAKTRIQNLKLAAAKIVGLAETNGIRIIDAQEIRANVGAKVWEDARMWFSSRQHPSFAALPALAKEYVRAFKAAFAAPKKICVLDLDNTLWGGIIGEDGISKIKVSAPDPEGEAFSKFQQYLLELKERGILLAVCSKNNEIDALLPFESHPEMRIKRSDLVSFKANWQPKSQNIAAMAKELNLGIDSFVFVDDNPVEIAEVSETLPQVSCVLLPKDSSDYIATLASKNFFDTVSISSDDIMRSATYAENEKREVEKSKSSSPENYLKSLAMECMAAEISEINLERAAQLAGKTNQFNMTTRRHSAEAIKSMAAQPRSYAKTFKLKDKFGDMGIVGVLIALPSDADTLEIDTFLLSCRALGRGLEHFAIADLADFAKDKGYKFVRGVYLPTQKNELAKNVFSLFGFSKENENSEEAWKIKVEDIRNTLNFIKKSES